jgi:hypothetical protein
VFVKAGAAVVGVRQGGAADGKVGRQSARTRLSRLGGRQQGRAAVGKDAFVEVGRQSARRGHKAGRRSARQRCCSSRRGRQGGWCSASPWDTHEKSDGIRMTPSQPIYGLPVSNVNTLLYVRRPLKYCRTSTSTVPGSQIRIRLTFSLLLRVRRPPPTLPHPRLANDTSTVLLT